MRRWLALVGACALAATFGGYALAATGTTIVVSPSGNGFAYVAWVPPVDEGGSAVSAYVVYAASGHIATISAAQFRTTGYAVLSRLTNGELDSFTVSARNASGTGTASLPSHSVTPTMTGIAVPSTPRSVTAVAGDGRVSIRFGLPPSTGGSPIVSYTIRGGGKTIRVPAHGRSSSY